MNQEFYFMDGKYVPSNEAVIPVRTHAFLYGTSVFEGIRGYWNKDENQLYVFRIKEHIERMFRSSKIMFLDPKYSVDEYTEIIKNLIKKNEYKENCYIRPEVYCSSLGISPGYKEGDSSVLIFSLKMGEYFEKEDGLNVCVSSWSRLEDNTIPPCAKISGAYANTALMILEAKKSGFDDAIALSADGKTAEGSSMNFFLVEGDTIVTTPMSSNILVGVTRNTVMEIAQKELGLKVEVREISRCELYGADEAFFCGTGVQIVPISTIDYRKIGTGKKGEITAKIANLYDDIVRGKNKKYIDWCTPVY